MRARRAGSRRPSFIAATIRLGKPHGAAGIGEMRADYQHVAAGFEQANRGLRVSPYT